jgi:hypothetical protein
MGSLNNLCCSLTKKRGYSSFGTEHRARGTGEEGIKSETKGLSDLGPKRITAL